MSNLVRKFSEIGWIDRRVIQLTAVFLMCLFIGWIFKDIRHNQTIIVGAIAGLFAWGQWHTARQKLVLDLFEKRYEKYVEVTSFIRNFSVGLTTDKATERAFQASVGEMKFLFGEDLVEPLREAADAMRSSDFYERLYDRARAEGDIETADKHYSKMMDGAKMYDDRIKGIEKLVIPYLRMDQKLPMRPGDIFG